MEFQAWPKIGRLNRDIVITEKIDGTNAAVLIEEGCSDGPGVIDTVLFEDRWYSVGAQSRNKLIWPGKQTDNAGFAAWVKDHADLLVAELGAGRHFGEWWGQGIQRNYDLDHKRFSLFNTGRYTVENLGPKMAAAGVAPVPVLGIRTFSTEAISTQLERLRTFGSAAAPGFMKPEGIVVFHTSTGTMFKVTLENDERPKGQK